MINDFRVGIPIVGGRGWLGGVSHMELHVKAITSLPRNERPGLFLIITEESLDSYELYRPFARLFDGIIFMGHDTDVAASIAALSIIHCATWDDLFEKIDFFFPVSFNVLPGRCAASWIHDFQHKHLPNFFSAHDIAVRDELCRRIADQSRLVFCSSRAVEKDFRRFYPHSEAVTRVLALRITPEDEWYTGNPIEVQKKYNLPDEFVVCSNQFWIHKNHRLLLEAVKSLRQIGYDVHLVCTGLTNDFRCPEYMDELIAYIDKLGITDLVHILGQIPRQDQVQLIRRCLFVVQPSLFEGLSLIVQECRVLGKPIILSDLDVHLEHEYGVYFQRTDVQDLTDKMKQLICHAQPGPNILRETEARLQATASTKRYAKDFCSMVEESQRIFEKSLITPPKSPVLIATSLVLTADISSQRRAVDSWLKAGFAVVSLNRPEDITTLKLDFPNIPFTAVSTNRSEGYGATHVSMNDLLDYFHQSDAAICGIVEPDICLYGSNLATYLAKEAVNCLVYQEKTGIDSIQNFEGSAFPGLGCVFFDRQLIVTYPSDDFSLDQPWWDYWSILLPIIRKIPVKRITTPFAYHITHAEHYDIESMLTFGKKLTEYTPLPFALSIETLAKYQYILAQIIRDHSLNIALCGLYISETKDEV